MASIAAERVFPTQPLVVGPPSPGWMSNPWHVISTSVSGVTTQDTAPHPGPSHG